MTGALTGSGSQTRAERRGRSGRLLGAVTGLLPRARDYAGLKTGWPQDLIAGLTVAVVALPLALAFGITSGLGARAGLVTAIVAGLIAAVFGGSSVQVSGPTGAMTVVLVPLVARYGTAAVPVVGLMAGALLLVAAVSGLGRYVAFLPWPVIEGFTLGIAIIIFLQQVPPALGVAKPRGENTAAVAVRAVAGTLHHGRVAAVGLTVGVALVLVVLPRLRRSLPASLLAVAAATAVAEWAHLDVARIGSLPASLPLPTLPSLSVDQVSTLFSAAFAVALLAGMESLLSAKVADGMADHPRHDPDRELFGQGLANLASPLFGGMPATGAIARTAVNVRAGARTRAAAAVHALALILVVLFAGPVVARIPLAALAGVLMVTAVRMVEIHNLKVVARATRPDALVLALTAGATVAFDLILAVEIGVAVAALLALRSIARASTATATTVSDDTSTERDDNERGRRADRIVTYRFDGALFFGAAERFLTELSDVHNVDVVILRLPDLQVLDATGAQALGQIVTALEKRGITVLLKGPRPAHLDILRTVGVLDRLAHQSHLFDTLDHAVQHAYDHVRRLDEQPGHRNGRIESTTHTATTTPRAPSSSYCGPAATARSDETRLLSQERPANPSEVTDLPGRTH
jgi:SulP family sulfate permease